MKHFTIILSLLFFGLSGCDEFLDVNENPNFPDDVEDYLLLPSAQAGVAGVMSADYGLIGSFWAQHWAQNNTSSQYQTFETYTLSSNDNRVDGSYLSMYRDGLGDNEIIHKKAEQEENWGLYLMTSTLKAYGFQYLVDFYGNVPYDEAFKGEEGNFTPVINTGEQVYASIYELLNTALEKDLDGFAAARYRQYDVLLDADIDDWVDFANTMKLRIILRQYAANTAWANTELTNLLAEGTFLTRDVALTNFEDVDS
ncbi:MAG: SusD/RagB family nutrient-binding outer membrane lipoprotein [Bacteroidales bacterium]|nr:SusD/RagB family nutrient-binding outer membrane lipoprotein [Bacteroidales bacterium]